MRIAAPAKLNLFLHIIGRRADGYHELETVFQLLDLHDTLSIEARADGRIRRHPAPTDALLASLPDAEDLTVRAATLLQQASGTSFGADIHVEKRIPAGGGLGGGSSDAAAVLLALNILWRLGWSRERLAELGLQLGSDIPVFVLGHSAFASGRGELLTPLQLPERWFLVVCPAVSVSTREIFSAEDLTRDTPRLKIRALPVDGGRNDCEPVVRRRYPQVAEALERLAPYGGRLTGTGACVFAAFETQAAAAGVAAQLPDRWPAFIARGLQRAPF